MTTFPPGSEAVCPAAPPERRLNIAEIMATMMPLATDTSNSLNMTTPTQPR